MMSDHKTNIIDGKIIVQTIRLEMASEIRRLSVTYGKVPGLAVVIVGQRKDSHSYVNMKRKAYGEVGFKLIDLDLSKDVTQFELIGDSKDCRETIELGLRMGVFSKALHK